MDSKSLYTLLVLSSFSILKIIGFALVLLVHIDLNRIAGDGIYDWGSVKKLLVKEIGWVDAEATDKGLHTSCKIERCKDYSQFISFRKKLSNVIPFSAVELSLAVGAGNISREQAREELYNHSGFSLAPPAEMEIMLAALNGKIAETASSSRTGSGKDRAPVK